MPSGSGLPAGEKGIKTMAKIKDGWHKVSGWDVYVEDGYILRGIDTDSNGSQVPVYVYRASHHGGYSREERITPAALRAGLNRGTIILR